MKKGILKITLQEHISKIDIQNRKLIRDASRAAQENTRKWAGHVNKLNNNHIGRM